MTRLPGTRRRWRSSLRLSGSPLLVLGLLLQTPIVSASPPSLQSLIHHNARLALREDRPRAALRLWLLRNSVASNTQRVSGLDQDFHSIVWAALGEAGLCQDGFPLDAADRGGAGLWPVAIHNWVVQTRRRSPAGPGPSPFGAFDHGYQRREITIGDVLDDQEFRSVRFRRGDCWRDTYALMEIDNTLGSIREPETAAQLQRHLLRKSLGTLSSTRVIGRAAIEARIFDLNLKLAALAERAAQKTQRKARLATGIEPDPQQEKESSVRPDSEEGRILSASLGWSAEEWMTLSSQRRQFLFGHVQQNTPEQPRALATKLSIIDALIEDRAGKELENWIAWVHQRPSDNGSPAQDGNAQQVKRNIWRGPRGAALMSLEPKTGFRERAVIALHRGVAALSEGRLPEALRLLAHALRWAEDSTVSEEVENLSRRWLSFVAAQFRFTDELLMMLRNVAPPGDFTAIVEDQLWHAALSMDSESFERCVKHLPKRGGLVQRAKLLSPLVGGESAAFVRSLVAEGRLQSHLSARIASELVARLQAESAAVRQQHAPLLKALAQSLGEEPSATTRSRPRRRVEAVLKEIHALLEGLGAVDPTDPAARTRTLSPDHKIFVGSLRLAPSDALPWPFTVTAVDAPSVFLPLSLRPVEWRDNAGQLVFGWRVSD